MPLPTARGLVATVKRVSSSERREVRSLGDGRPHGLGARGGGALLGFDDALKIF
jgi:hypothetical protein